MAQRVQSQTPERKEAQAAGFKLKSELRVGGHQHHTRRVFYSDKRRSNCHFVRLSILDTHTIGVLHKGHESVVFHSACWV